MNNFTVTLSFLVDDEDLMAYDLVNSEDLAEACEAFIDHYPGENPVELEDFVASLDEVLQWRKLNNENSDPRVLTVLNAEVADLIKGLIECSGPKNATYKAAYTAYAERLRSWVESEGYGWLIGETNDES